MNTSVSNIAWKKEENWKAIDILKEQGISCIDIAPTNVFDSVETATKAIIAVKKEEYAKRGISFAAMQSLLFGLPKISIFDGENEREAISSRLMKVFFIAKEMGIKKAVFGSPENRRIRDFDYDNMAIAVEFFRNAANMAKKHGIIVCFEPNPKEYNCNFITSTAQAVEFIRKVGMPNFRLNFDTSTVILNEDKFSEVMDYSHQFIEHVHISSPNIMQITDLNHKEISGVLRSYSYKGHVSLEMKPNITDDNLKTLKKNVEVFAKYYLD